MVHNMQHKIKHEVHKIILIIKEMNNGYRSPLFRENEALKLD